MSKLSILLKISILLTFLSHFSLGGDSNGIGDFLVKLCNNYSKWLASNYRDPSTPLDFPINVTIATSPGGDYVDAIFTDYQMFGHSNPENWQFTDWNVDLSLGRVEVMFQVKRTRFGGKYDMGGIYDGKPVNGKGTWNITTVDLSYISFGLHYYGVNITEDNYLDLNGGPIQSVQYYVSKGDTSNVREMDGLVAGESEQEEVLKNKIFDALEMQTRIMNEHPLPMPLNGYLQVAFSVTRISDMQKMIDEKNQI